MAGRTDTRFSFQLRILLLLLGSCWLLAGTFMVFQYHRERDYKTGMMNTRLQMHNARLLDDLRKGEPIGDIVGRISSPTENLRVTLIRRDGKVIYDSNGQTPTSDHNTRPEVRAARVKGEGYAIERVSEEDNTTYFYSALSGDDGMVIRSAAPYTHTLVEFLAIDRTILFIMGGLTLIISIIGLLATHKITVSIRQLNQFAEKAGNGDRIYEGYSFPHDELGSIAANIVKIYVQRDQQHRETIRLEQDKARLKKQLTNNINHELKTPVASILVSLDLLDDHPDLPEAKRRVTHPRLEDGRGMIDKKRIDLSALINEIVEEARPRTEMHIYVNMPRLWINGDRMLLESIFHNLIDNAIAYSGGTEIHISADDAGNFKVWDNGKGIDARHLPHIFERFYRVDDGRARPAGGTGLGLSIVKNAVAVHGGSIRAISTKGLLFEFSLACSNQSI